MVPARQVRLSRAEGVEPPCRAVLVTRKESCRKVSCASLSVVLGPAKPSHAKGGEPAPTRLEQRDSKRYGGRDASHTFRPSSLGCELGNRLSGRDFVGRVGVRRRRRRWWREESP